MRKITLVSLAVVTVFDSIATPSFAQVRGGAAAGGGQHTTSSTHHEGRGEYIAVPPRKRKPVITISAKGGAYCSTNLRVLFDENGRRTRVRHCDERNLIEID